MKSNREKTTEENDQPDASDVSVQFSLAGDLARELRMLSKAQPTFAHCAEIAEALQLLLSAQESQSRFLPRSVDVLSDKKPKILVVDDDKCMQRILCSILEKNYEMHATSSGPEALVELLKACEGDARIFDGILLDVQMPGMDGFQVHKLVRSIQYGDEYPYMDIPIIIVTATVDAKKVLESQLPGTVDFVDKESVRENIYSLTTILERRLREASQRKWLKRLDAMQLKSEQKYRRLFEESIDPIYISSREGTFLDVNSAMEEFLGYTREEMMGMDVREIYLDPADREKFQKEIEENEFVQNREMRFRGKDGKELFCEVTATVRRNSGGEVTGYQGIMRDITDMRKLESQLRQRQKMEALGKLVGGIAHNFNNLLMVIIGNAEIIAEKYPEDRENWEPIQIASECGSELIKQLRMFGQKEEAIKTNIDVGDIISEVAKMIARLLDPHIELSVIRTNVSSVFADPGQIHQVVLNLCTNACDAVENSQKKRITLSAENISIDINHCMKIGRGRPGNFVRISVDDTGCGMDEETKRHIFEPFFTTKDVGKGTGLGLATAYGTVKKHDGWIGVESAPNEGTTFSIFLPAIEGKSVTTEKEGRALEVPRGKGTILVVEDEEDVRMLLSSTLASQGYTVIEAVDGIAALDQCWKSEQCEIDLVVLDISMPHVSGHEVIEELRKVKLNIPVLVVTGNTMQEEIVGTEGILYKPFQMQDLHQAVADVLEKRQGEDVQ